MSAPELSSVQFESLSLDSYILHLNHCLVPLALPLVQHRLP